MQPVQIVDLIETVDGVEKRQLRSESDQIAIGKGLRFALIDCNEIFVEGNIDGEGDVSPSSGRQALARSCTDCPDRRRWFSASKIFSKSP